MVDSSGEALCVPPSRPGWFELDNVGDDGLPTKLCSTAGLGRWKFWTQNDSSFRAAAVRSYVTSSGTCSLDLGIPSFAKHPNFMIRECYQSRTPPVYNPLDEIWSIYEQKTLARDDAEIREFFKSLDLTILSQPHSETDEFTIGKNRERLVDLAGKKRLIEENFCGLQYVGLQDMSKALATTPDEDTVYVIGHSRPNADAIVGAVFEAVRRSLYYEKKCVCWAQRVPNVVKYILGPQICDIIAQVPKFGPTHNIVLVDCHEIDQGEDHQIKAIIDHHIINQTFPYYIAISQEVSWSSTVQIYIKFLGSGFDLDCAAAKLLLDATLIEAEPSLMDNMSELDHLVLTRLKTLSEGHRSYPSLMGLLTWDTMSGDPFMTDYKQSSYGFSVIKTLEEASYASQAQAVSLRRHLPLTVVKQVVYDSQFQYIKKELISMYFNPKFHDKGFQKAIMHITRSACEALHGTHHVTSNDFEIEISKVSHQTPRLLLGPLLESVVKEHLRFFYSQTLKMYVACGFYTNEQGEYASSSNEPNPTTGICFDEVKSLLCKTKKISFMSLPQYWQVYQECQKLKDAVTLRSLRSASYVKLLNTVIHNSTDVINCDGKSAKVSILDARPALIRPEDINIKTGFPGRLVSPNQYSDNELWRYWSPDRPENVATRGHIFVMDQTCIDLKIGRLEKTQQLTFRPIYKDIPDIKYELNATKSGNWVSVTVLPRLFSITPDSSRSRRLSDLVHEFPNALHNISRKLQHKRE